MDIYTYIAIAVTAVIVVINLLTLFLSKKAARVLSIINVILHLGVIAILLLGKKSLDILFLVMLISVCSALVFSQIFMVKKGESK